MGQLAAGGGRQGGDARSARLGDGEHTLRADCLDDSTPDTCSLSSHTASRMRIDFNGHRRRASSGNLNAPPAVVQAAVIYVLRCLVAERYSPERRLSGPGGDR